MYNNVELVCMHIELSFTYQERKPSPPRKRGDLKKKSQISDLLASVKLMILPERVEKSAQSY